MQMRKPVIGVMPLYDDEKESQWMVPGYFDGLLQAGAVPLMLPLGLDEDGFAGIREHIDGYLFTGGHDVDPALYQEQPIPEDEAFCDARDALESMVFYWCWSQDVPALGICRGIQFFNVARGGTLWQDIPAQYQARFCSCASSCGSEQKGRTASEAASALPLIRHTMAPPYAEHHAEHDVLITKDSPLEKLLGKTRIQVNSYHHQAVKEIGTGLVPMAHSEDGLVEAVYAPEKMFLWAVQWHPEFTFREDENSRKIFQALVKASM